MMEATMKLIHPNEELPRSIQEKVLAEVAERKAEQEKK